MDTKEDLLAWINAKTDHATYTDKALLRMMDFTRNVPDHGHIVEIGVFWGRTAAIYLWEGTIRPLHISLIDAWVLNESDSRPGFDRLVKEIPQPYRPGGWKGYWMQSKQAANLISPNSIDLLHIDGDHDFGAWDDCERYLPKVKVGGVAVVHDYGNTHGNYPRVIQAVDHYFDDKWEKLGVVDSQFAARKLR